MFRSPPEFRMLSGFLSIPVVPLSKLLPILPALLRWSSLPVVLVVLMIPVLPVVVFEQISLTLPHILNFEILPLLLVFPSGTIFLDLPDFPVLLAPPPVFLVLAVESALPVSPSLLHPEWKKKLLLLKLPPQVLC